jgi:hypothetical protein
MSKGIQKMKRLGWIWIFLIFLSCWACRDKSPGIDEQYLVRVGKETFTVDDFKRSFELLKITYQDETSADPETLHDLQARHLKEIIEELILLERAKELQLEITDQELENAVWKIQKDYPDGSFEQLLLEKAICFSYWKESLRIKLLKDRVVFEELEKNITVMNEEIKEFYESHFDGTYVSPENEKKAMVLSQEIIRQLRKEKAKEQYPSWIKGLWIRYGVELNDTAWSKFINYES